MATGRRNHLAAKNSAPTPDWRTKGPLALFDDADERMLLRVIVDVVADDQEIVLDLTDLVDGGYLDEIDEAENAWLSSWELDPGPPIIITEVSYDALVLRSALEILKPHLSTHVRFLDYNMGNEGGASAAVRIVKSFAAAGILNHVVAGFDNDNRSSPLIPKTMEDSVRQCEVDISLRAGRGWEMGPPLVRRDMRRTPGTLGCILTVVVVLALASCTSPHAPKPHPAPSSHLTSSPRPGPTGQTAVNVLPPGFSHPATMADAAPVTKLNVITAGAITPSSLVLAPLPAAALRPAAYTVLTQPVSAIVHHLLVSNATLTAGRQVTVVATGLRTGRSHDARFILQSGSSRAQALVGISSGTAAAVVTMPARLDTGTWILAVEDLSGIGTSGKRLTGTAALDLGVFDVTATSVSTGDLSVLGPIAARLSVPSTVPVPHPHPTVRPFASPAVQSGAVAACRLLNQRVPNGNLVSVDEPLDYLTDDGAWESLMPAAATIRRSFDSKLASLDATDSDRFTLETLQSDNDEIKAARIALDEIAAPLITGDTLTVDLYAGRADVAAAYRSLREAYLTADIDFAAAGLPTCATPLIIEVPGPGPDDASGDPIEFRVTAACPTLNIVWQDEQDAAGLLETSAGGSIKLGATTDPQVTRKADAYESVLTSDLKFWIYSVSCAPGSAPKTTTSTEPEPSCHGKAELAIDHTLAGLPKHPWPIPVDTIRAPEGSGLQVVVEAGIFDAQICEEGLTAKLANPPVSSSGTLEIEVPKILSGGVVGPFDYDITSLAWQSARGMPLGQSLKTTFQPAVTPSFLKLSINLKHLEDSEFVIAEVTLHPVDNEVKLVDDGTSILSASIGPELSVGLVFKGDESDEDADALEEGESAETAATATADEMAVEADELIALELDSFGLTSDESAVAITQIENETFTELDSALLGDESAIDAEADAEAQIAADDLDTATIDTMESTAGAGIDIGADDILVTLLAFLI